ncbi:MAG: hypothetical protein AAGA48_22725 [Myxococcota bacterium]
MDDLRYDPKAVVHPWPTHLPVGVRSLTTPRMWQRGAVARHFIDNDHVLVASSLAEHRTPTEWDVRWDMVAQWNVHTRERVAAWPLRGITALAPTEQGPLWIAGRGWLGRWTPSPHAPDVRLWPSSPVLELHVHPDDSERVAWRSAGGAVGVTGRDGTTLFERAEGYAIAVAWVGQRVAVAMPGRIALWHPQTQDVQTYRRATPRVPSPSRVPHALLATDGRLWTSWRDGRILVLDAESLHCLGAHVTAPGPVDLAAGPEATVVVASPGSLEALTQEGEIVRASEARGAQPQWSPDWRTLVTSTGDFLRTWDGVTWAPRLEVVELAAPGQVVAHKGQIVIGGTKGIETWTEQRPLGLTQVRFQPTTTALSDDGRTVAYLDGRVARQLDARTGAERAQVVLDGPRVREFHPELDAGGRRVAFHWPGETVVLVDFETQTVRAYQGSVGHGTWVGHEFWVQAGTEVVALTETGSTRPVFSTVGWPAERATLHVTPDQKLALLVDRHEGTVAFRIATGTLVWRSPAFAGRIRFDPTSQRFLCANRVCSTADGACIGFLTGPHAAASADWLSASEVVVAGKDRTLAVWPIASLDHAPPLRGEDPLAPNLVRETPEAEAVLRLEMRLAGLGDRRLVSTTEALAQGRLTEAITTWRPPRNQARPTRPVARRTRRTIEGLLQVEPIGDRLIVELRPDQIDIVISALRGKDVHLTGNRLSVRIRVAHTNAVVTHDEQHWDVGLVPRLFDHLDQVRKGQGPCAIGPLELWPPRPTEPLARLILCS